jgi:replication factor A1
LRPPASASFISIRNLSPYLTTWTIRAKVVQKGQMRTWNNSRGSGNLFSLVLKDKEGSEIQGTFFKTDADNWFSKIDVDRVYIVSGGKIKIAGKKFNNTKCEYEIGFDSTTRFEATDDDGIGSLSYQYLPQLSAINDLKVDDITDVIAIVEHADPVGTISTKRGQNSRRAIRLCDPSQVSVEFTLWGQEAESFPDDATGRVLQIKAARVGDYRGRQLGTTNNSIIRLDPPVPEAAALRRWWDEGGSAAEFQPIAPGGEMTSQMGYLAVVNEQKLGTKLNTSDYFAFYAVLEDVPVSNNRQLVYMACPNPNCKNKKLEGSDGDYTCRLCSAQIRNPRPRFAFSFKVADFSGSAFISGLGEDAVGQAVLGVTAQEWVDQLQTVDESRVQALATVNRFREYKIRCRVKADEYGGDVRPKLSTMTIAPLNYAEAAKFFAAEIEKFTRH